MTEFDSEATMKTTHALLIAALTASAAWAGSHGNGADQRNGFYARTQTSYAYCYGGNQHVAYFSRVFALTPAVRSGGGAFGHYLDRMGYHNDGGQCRSAPTEAGAVAGKSESENTFRSAEYHHRRIVETEWAGAE